jgi:hypothetical protein
MRVLFDQAIPVPIRTFLIGHTVRTASQQRWDTLKNGELLTVAEQAGFEIFLTTDKNMRHRQNMAGRTIAVVVIGVQQWPALQPDVALIVAAVNTATPAASLRWIFRSTDRPARHLEAKFVAAHTDRSSLVASVHRK